METIFLAGSMSVIVAVAAGLFHREPASLRAAAGAVLAVASSGLHLYMVRAPLSTHEFWLGVLFAYVVPICATLALTRRMASSKPKIVVGLSAFVLYVAVLVLSMILGSRAGAFYR